MNFCRAILSNYITCTRTHIEAFTLWSNHSKTFVFDLKASNSTLRYGKRNCARNRTPAINAFHQFLFNWRWRSQITGVSGFIGFATLSRLLSSNYHARAVVRSPTQIPKIRAALRRSLGSDNQVAGNVEFVIVEDLKEDGAFDGVLEGVQYVAHVASPMPTSAVGILSLVLKNKAKNA
jgi:hypothetical protein